MLLVLTATLHQAILKFTMFMLLHHRGGRTMVQQLTLTRGLQLQKMNLLCINQGRELKFTNHTLLSER